MVFIIILYKYIYVKIDIFFKNNFIKQIGKNDINICFHLKNIINYISKKIIYKKESLNFLFVIINKIIN